MSGIYLHIPFCKQACHYCNFHFSTNLDREADVVDAICKEIVLRKDFLFDKNIETLYLGGGTPSLISRESLEKLMKQLSTSYELTGLKEFTLEANPDDITEENLSMWKDIGVNRFSLGVQSFFDEDLVYMNRAHSSKQSYKSIELIRKARFANFSIDLIYGGHVTSSGMLLTNIHEAVQLKIPHLSIYGMTVEEKTALHSFIEKGKLEALDDAKQAFQFNLVMDQMAEDGYDQYEISNYCKDRKYAKHNTNYWKGAAYVGFGPSAHSFDGLKRSWNISDNNAYVTSIENGELFSKEELLTDKDKYNEYLLTGLRTKWGVSLEKIETEHKAFLSVFKTALENQKDSKKIIVDSGKLLLSKEGKLIADNVISEFFAT